MKQSITRRLFIESGSAAGAATLLPAFSLNALSSGTPPSRQESAYAATPGQDGILFRELALQAVDAAKQAGATYADVRITRTLSVKWSNGDPDEAQTLAVGVRALVNGYWGFASGPYWIKDEMRRLSQEAVSQARVNARGKPRTVDFTPLAAAAGAWITPIQTDPFTVSFEEIMDFAQAWTSEIKQYRRGLDGGNRFQFQRVEKTCASTEGSLFTQTLYNIGGSFELRAKMGKPVALDFPLVGAGWEYFQDGNVFAEIPRLIEESEQFRLATVNPVEIGRYPMVFDAQTMASLTGATIGPATQLDRALGYEANATGTSFLNRPLEMLGTLGIAAPMVNITADRTMTRGLSTVKWDDEGVPATPFPIVKNGVIVDYQTMREQSAWLAPYYEKIGKPVQSRGCADTLSALDLPIQHTPNLTLEPGTENIGFDEMVSQISRGFVLMGGKIQTDFQIRHGSNGRGTVREITNGRLGAYIENAGILFNTEEIWKSIIALGGSQKRELGVGTSIKGEPEQVSLFSISAVPAMFKEVSIIDVKRKA